MSHDLVLDARSRLDLIESMIDESRHGFMSYAWCFVLWGCGHAAALLWQRYLPHPLWAWCCTMIPCALISGWVMMRRRRRAPAQRKVGTAVGAVWLAFSAGVVVIFGCDRQQPLEDFFLLYGAAHIASGMAVRYHLQAVVGLGWLALAAAALVSRSPQVEQWGFLVMALCGEILFGMLTIALERRGTHGA